MSNLSLDIAPALFNQNVTISVEIVASFRIKLELQPFMNNEFLK